MTRSRGTGRLRHQRLQTALAVVAVAVGVALPVVLLSVGGGVSSHELAQLQNAGYQIVVSASGLHGVAHAHSLADEVGSIASVAAASPVLSLAVDAFPHGNATPVLAEGVIPGPFDATLGPAESGLFPHPLPLGDPTDSVHYANGSYAGPATREVLVSSPLEDAFHIGVGDSLRIAATAEGGNATEFRVTGTFGVPPTALGPTGAFAVLLPLSDLQVLTGYAAGASVPDAVDTLEVAVTGPVATDPVALGHVRSEIQALVPYYSVSSLSQEAAQLQSAASVLTGFYLALSSVGLAVGLVFLALVLVRRVERDRRAIGIRRAIGVPRRSIVVGVLGDGLRLATAGSLSGVLLGYALVASLATWGTSTVQEATRLAIFAPTELGLLIVGVVGLSLLAGASAARTALRLDLAEALR